MNIEMFTESWTFFRPVLVSNWDWCEINEQCKRLLFELNEGPFYSQIIYVEFTISPSVFLDCVNERNSSVIALGIQVKKYLYININTSRLPGSLFALYYFVYVNENGSLFLGTRFETRTWAWFIWSIKQRCLLEKRPDVFIVFVRFPCPLTVKNVSLDGSASVPTFSTPTSPRSRSLG